MPVGRNHAYSGAKLWVHFQKLLNFTRPLQQLLYAAPDAGEGQEKVQALHLLFFAPAYCCSAHHRIGTQHSCTMRLHVALQAEEEQEKVEALLCALLCLYLI